MSLNESYRSPLETRYASDRMRAVWSPQRKFSTWRRLWVALAEAQQELGLAVTDRQLDELRAHVDDIDFDAAERYEAETRHDVMAHIHAFGDAAPSARPIIHLGATSQYVVCNTDLILIRDGLRIVAEGLAAAIVALGDFALRYRALPTLGYTHYQPAQPTTVGKRAATWAHDLALSLEDVEHRIETLRFRGIKGATGTQASFLKLFDGDHEKVERLDEMVTAKMGWPPQRRYAVTGQTYPRVVDAQVTGTLAAAAAAVHKCCNDVRLLASRKEIEEPLGERQVGSSTMAYKRNPMLCERATGLSRFVMSLASSALATAATQWLERTLDDSSNRRLVLPESFLAIDGAIATLGQVAGGLVVHEKTIAANLMAELPFLASEDVIMAAVRAGGDRQAVHEVIRRHSRAAACRVKEEGAANDLLERLRGDPALAGVDLAAVLDPAAYVGRAPRQVDAFLESVVEPIRTRYAPANRT